MKAVMYGAGNIGRGFLGALFCQSGYRVTFIDVNDAVVDALNARGAYPVRTVSNDGHEDITVSPVSAINGRDSGAAARAIAEADVMATAVGVRALPLIADVLAQGLKLRLERRAAPLNIIICENLLDANRVLRKLIMERLPYTADIIDASVGFVEASIGRMVPVQTEAMQDGDPLRVCVERYGFLPVDRDAFVGPIPDIQGMVPRAPFDFYIRRKLFLHNMGHALCAYLGLYAGHRYIYQSIADPEIRLMCLSAMTEGALALSARYKAPAQALFDHVFDLIDRFSNCALMDTCARVGGDIPRKMGPHDRLIGAARLCGEMGVIPAHIAAGCALALLAHLTERGVYPSRENASDALTRLSGVMPDEPLFADIMAIFALAAVGRSVRDIRMHADSIRRARVGDVI